MRANAINYDYQPDVFSYFFTWDPSNKEYHPEREEEGKIVATHLQLQFS